MIFYLNEVRQSITFGFSNLRTRMETFFAFLTLGGWDVCLSGTPAKLDVLMDVLQSPRSFACL